MQVLSRIGVVSLAKFLGMFGVLLGLLVGIVFAGFTILFSLIGAAVGGNEEAMGMGAAGVVGGLFSIVLFPLAYGAGSFIAGLIYGLFINLALRFSGGLELEFKGNA